MLFKCSEKILHLQLIVCTKQSTVDWRGGGVWKQACHTIKMWGSSVLISITSLLRREVYCFSEKTKVWCSVFSFAAAHPQHSRGHGHRVPSPTRFALQTCLEEPDRRPPQTDHPGQRWENGLHTAAAFHSFICIGIRKVDSLLHTTPKEAVK